MPRDLPTGITRKGKGYRVFVRLRLGPKQSRLKSRMFPDGTPLAEMRAWRESERVKARTFAAPRAASHTLRADIESRYLPLVRTMPSYQMRKSDLDAWCAVYGTMRRHELTPALIREQLQIWRTSGPRTLYLPKTKTWRTIDKPLSASACNHRRTALLHVFTLLDGKDAPNPVKAVPPFPEPPPQPRAQSVAFLEAAISRMRNPKMRAIATVLLWTGIRGNSEYARMTAAHVDLDAGVCLVPTGKRAGATRLVPLNAKGIAAWREVLSVGALGPYDRSGMRKAFQLAVRREAKAKGLPEPSVRVYDLRHSVATAYRKAGADLADIQDMLGHTTPRMTSRYASFQLDKLRKAGDQIE